LPANHECIPSSYRISGLFTPANAQSRLIAALSFLQKDLICGEYHERVTINTPPMPDENEVIHKLILSAIVILGTLLGHAIASALFHIPGI
jgi:hypothetical protein